MWVTYRASRASPPEPRLSPAGDRLLAYISGRRLRAYWALREQDPTRFRTIPAFVDSKEDPQVLADSIAENLHRQDLTAVETGVALWEYKQLLGCTHEAVAKLLGISPGYVRALTMKARQVYRNFDQPPKSQSVHGARMGTRSSI